MSSQREKFARLNVVSPCEADWNEMSGNESKRHCAACNKNVFDFSQMTPRQVEAIVAATKGNLCARVTRDETGALVTLPHTNKPEFSPVYQRRSGAPLAKAMVSALLSLSVPTVAMLPVLTPLVATARSADALDVEDSPTTGEASATISGMVTDSYDAVIPNALVTLIDQATLLERTLKTSDDGRFSFDGLMPGAYTLQVQASGFIKTVRTEIALAANQAEEITFKLNAGERLAFGGAIAIQPKSLRELYEESELIVAALVGQSMVVEKDENTSLIKTALHYSEVIKGETRQRVVYTYHHQYNEELDETYTAGKSLLAFLKRRRDDEGLKLRDGYETTDYQGIKSLTPEGIQTYRQSIDELKSLLANGEPDRMALVEWLVRCAEEPATRWDGVYELERMGRQSSRLKRVEIILDAKRTEAPSELLNEAQKNRLVTALVNSPQFTSNEAALLELVAEWKDERLVPFMITQLGMIANDAPPEADLLMQTIAKVLGDNDLKSLAEEYSNVARYLDDAPAEESEAEETVSSENEPKNEAENQAENNDDANESDHETPEVSAPTKAERAPYIRKFLTLLANKRSY